MSRSKKQILPFSINSKKDNTQSNLSILNTLKNEGNISLSKMQNITGISAEKFSACIDACVDKKLVKIESDTLSFRLDSHIFLGIGFSDNKSYCTLINSLGDILESEKIDIEPLHKFKGKKKEVLEILSVLKQHTKFSKYPITLCGVALPERLVEVGEKNIALLSEGIGRIFNSNVYFCRSVTASGYGEKEFGEKEKGKDILYLHSDIGCGVVIKGEEIFQSENETSEDENSYLRSWEQFGIEGIAKNLVNKGVGSSLINMVNGKIDEITLEMVLRAAEEEDELAKDLVVRSGLALGVRAAYLANFFEVYTVILGGGTEGKRGNFEDFVKESANKFLKKKLAGKINVCGGKMGVKAASFGAANLCIRELFLEG